MKTRVHVNQHVIKRNSKTGEREHPLTVKDYAHNRKCSCARIFDADGQEVARVVYQPDDPLPCGATCWIETDLYVETMPICKEAHHHMRGQK